MLISDFPDIFSSRSKKWYLLFLLVATIMLLGLYRYSLTIGWESATRLGIAYGTAISVIHIIWRLSFKPRNFLAPDIIYIMSFYVFHFGILILWAVHIFPTESKALDRVFYHPSQYALVMVIVNLALIGFIIGYELLSPKISAYNPGRAKVIPSSGWIFMGALVMVIALGIHVFYIFYAGFENFLRYGYQVYIHMERYVEYPRMWRMQFHIFLLGTAIYFSSVALITGKIIKGKFGIIIFATYLTLVAVEGGRTQLITACMVLILIRHYLVRPIKLKWLLLFAVILLTLFTSIKIVRNVASFDVSKASEELKYSKDAGLLKWYAPFVEMGGSVGTINLTTMLVPESQAYWHGRTYMQAIAHIVPYMSTFAGRFLGMSPSTWLTYTHFGPNSAGTGFSIAAEGYLNFGLPGTFIQMLIIGAFFRILYTRLFLKLSPINALLFFVSYGLLMTGVRNHLNLLISPLTKLIALTWFFQLVLGVEYYLPEAEIDNNYLQD